MGPDTMEHLTARRHISQQSRSNAALAGGMVAVRRLPVLRLNKRIEADLLDEHM